MKHLKGAAREGARAFFAGKPVNPYQPGVWHDLWAKGYTIAQNH